MSIYRCGICDEYKDVDFHGCNEHPHDEYECICDDCETEKLPEYEMFIDLVKEGRK
jgi:hypothetical protein